MKRSNALKKIAIIGAAVLGIVIVSVILLSRFTGAGMRFPDGRYLGYSASRHGDGEWLFMQYQNVHVRYDGPYVFSENGLRHAIYIQGDDKVSSRVIDRQVTNEVEVLVDNEAVTRFVVPLRENYMRSQLSIPSPERLLAISDLEGDFDAMVNLLQANKVIDDSLNWSYGSGHLVLIGDMVDRGTNVVPLLWLTYKLEAEARAAGGDVHYVLGNHERYLLDGRVKSAARKYHGTFRVTEMSSNDLWSKDSELGRWLRSKPVLLKIGETLFAHGGISPEVLSTNPTLKSIDEDAEKNFVIGDVIKRNVDGSVIHGSSGILFYRGLAQDMSSHDLYEKADIEHVENILKAFQVERIAIGHTLAQHIGHDYEGKVIRVDVHHSAKVSEALLIENDLLWRMDDKGNRYPLNQAENKID